MNTITGALTEPGDARPPALILKFEYQKLLVGLIKLFPPKQRSYDPEKKEWTVALISENDLALLHDLAHTGSFVFAESAESVIAQFHTRLKNTVIDEHGFTEADRTKSRVYTDGSDETVIVAKLSYSDQSLASLKSRIPADNLKFIRNEGCWHISISPESISGLELLSFEDTWSFSPAATELVNTVSERLENQKEDAEGDPDELELNIKGMNPQ